MHFLKKGIPYDMSFNGGEMRNERSVREMSVVFLKGLSILVIHSFAFIYGRLMGPFKSPGDAERRR